MHRVAGYLHGPPDTRQLLPREHPEADLGAADSRVTVANGGMVFGHFWQVSANEAGESTKNPAINIQPLRVVILCEKIFRHLALLFSKAAHSSAVPLSSHHGVPAARMLTAGATGRHCLRSHTAMELYKAVQTAKYPE
jgi:hypothetical protein